MGQCNEEELMEIVMPRLADVMTLYEFLMMKVESERKEGHTSHVHSMLREYEAFNAKVIS